MALTAAQILTRAQDIIQDTLGVRWSEAELLRYLNDGRREMGVARPDVYAVTSVMTLATGTKQNIPTDGSRFLDGIRNVGNDDSPGRAIRIVEREILDAARPMWHTETQTATIQHFMYDERTPKVFYVYPPSNGGKLEISYSQAPTDITVTSTELVQEGIYASALVDYLCYRAFSKDSEYAGDDGRSVKHYNQFLNALGIGNRMNALTSPNVARTDGAPSRTAAVQAQ